jgi:hypothetical protein
MLRESRSEPKPNTAMIEPVETHAKQTVLKTQNTNWSVVGSSTERTRYKVQANAMTAPPQKRVNKNRAMRTPILSALETDRSGQNVWSGMAHGLAVGSRASTPTRP